MEKPTVGHTKVLSQSTDEPVSWNHGGKMTYVARLHSLHKCTYVFVLGMILLLKMMHMHVNHRCDAHL